jgi:hypothetical protein
MISMQIMTIIKFSSNQESPVQARELTTLQSILQNQINKFGQHFFKEGAKVIPGNTGYTQLYYCVQLTKYFFRSSC